MQLLYREVLISATGTFDATAYNQCVLTGLTEDRIKTLKIWLTGTIEGDVCAGSVKEVVNKKK